MVVESLHQNFMFPLFNLSFELKQQAQIKLISKYVMIYEQYI